MCLLRPLQGSVMLSHAFQAHLPRIPCLASLYYLCLKLLYYEKFTQTRTRTRSQLAINNKVIVDLFLLCLNSLAAYSVSPPSVQKLTWSL